MSQFVNNKNYSFTLESRIDGVYLVSKYPEIDILLDFETLAYYFKHYTLQKGGFSNGFRKILCDDGVERFYNREHPEYEASVKAETLSIKDISEGMVLADNNGNEYIYIGSFYKDQYRRDKRKRWHFFYRKDRKQLDYQTNLKMFKAVIGTDPEYTSKLVNFEILCSKKTDIHLTQK